MTQTMLPPEQELRAAFEFLKGSKVPSVPEVVQKLNQEFASAQPDINRISQLASQDQSIAGLLLKTVNSPLFGLAEPVESISQAAVLLGLKQLRNLIAGAALEKSLQLSTDTAKSIWQDSLEVAQCAMRIAADVDAIEPDEAYLAGLLHDSGALLLAEVHPSYADLLAAQASFPISLIERENRQYGTNHIAIGYLFAKHWNLPEALCLAIYQHHSSSCKQVKDSETRALIATLKVANHIVNQHTSAGDDVTFESIQYVAQAKAELMLSEDEFTALQQETAVEY